MQTWLDLDHVRARCLQLRAEAARMRLARLATASRRRSARQRVAIALETLGAALLDAGDRVRGDARLAS